MKRKTKPAKDPLAGIRKNYQGKWRVKHDTFYVNPHIVEAFNKDGWWEVMAMCSYKQLARLICRMGNGK